MVRRHGQVPAGWQWRDGRPRWFASPALRKAGWKGLNLQDAKGHWLGRGASIDAAETISEAVTAWRNGELVPRALAAIAPPGAVETPGAGLPVTVDRFAIGALLLAWMGDPKSQPPVAPSPEFAKLAPKTQGDYRGKLKRLVDTLAGYAVLPAKDAPAPERATYAARVAQVRAMSVLALEPAETAAGIDDPLHAAYWALHGAAGEHQAFGVLAAASAWLTWCRKRQSRQIHNWAKEVRRDTPPGRLRVATWPELQALVETADANPEWLAVGDGIVLGLDLTWSEADLLALPWLRIINNRALTGEEGRQKTGRVGGTPFTYLGLARLQKIRERQAGMKVKPHKVIHLERSRDYARGETADAELFRKRFAKVRAAAAERCPSVATLTFADIRDTAWTMGREAGFLDDETASRSLQSRKNIANLGDKHYGEISPAIADAAKDKLEAYFKKIGASL